MRFNYKKPELHNGLQLELKESRHPVIERNLPVGETYIANDIVLNEEQQIIILTGPNMSGKSAIFATNSINNFNGTYGKLCSVCICEDSFNR